MLFEPTLSIVDGAQHKYFVGRCQRRFSVHASTFVGFPGGAANSLVTLALQVRFSLFAQHVHNIYFAEFPQIGSGESPRFTESERSSKAHATCLFIFEAGIVNQRCERAVGVDAEVEVLVYKKVGAGTLADDFEIVHE